MEIEPVSRYLGEYCLMNTDDEAYCVFITAYLKKNGIYDFRSSRNMQCYNTSETEWMNGMKILPIQTSELKTLLCLEVK